MYKPTRPVPGKPIVSSFVCPTERISSYVDSLLQPHLKSLHFIKDTNDFLSKIKEHTSVASKFNPSCD